VGFVRAKRNAKKKVVKKLIKKKKKKKKKGKTTTIFSRLWGPFFPPFPPFPPSPFSPFGRNGTIFSRLFSFFLPLQWLDFDAGLPDRMLEVQKWPKIAKKCQKMPT
jgi:hypothetical protein